MKKPNAAPEVSLRPAAPGDYAFALRLYLDGTKRLLVALGRWDEGRVVARFRRAFEPEQAQVIRVDGADIGWLQISESIEGFHLQQLHIVARFRNRGIGTGLIEALQSRARRIRRPIALKVVRGNPALSLYRRLGFRIVGGTKEKLRMRWAERPAPPD